MISESLKDGMRRCNNAKITSAIVLIAVIFACSGCRRDNRHPDVSHLDGAFSLVRSEQILFGLDSLANPDSVKAIFAQHTPFWELYFKQVMRTPEDTNVRWQTLIKDPFLQALNDSVSREYRDMDDIQAQLSSAFQYLQYYFPGNRVPNVYTLISGFGYFPFIFEDGNRDGLGISLEMFLGSDFPYRLMTGDSPVFSDYLVRTYNRDHLAKRTIDVVVDDLVGPPPGDRLVDEMIHNGIKLYIVEHLMPDLADTVLFEFTPKQLSWCISNERNLWAHFLDHDLLYSRDVNNIQKLISPAPAVPGMPSEAPGGVANWTGWKIIHALKQREPSLKMTDLLVLHDAQNILERARYRPQ